MPRQVLNVYTWLGPARSVPWSVHVVPIQLVSEWHVPLMEVGQLERRVPGFALHSIDVKVG